MVLEYFETIIIMLFIVSIIGYILSVLKEKLYLNKNIIYIDKKSVTKEHIEKTDIKEFSIGEVKVKAGDEVKFILSQDKNITGIVIGAIKNENSIVIVTHKDRIIKFTVDKIKKIRVISKYGKFFS